MSCNCQNNQSHPCQSGGECQCGGKCKKNGNSNATEHLSFNGYSNYIPAPIVSKSKEEKEAYDECYEDLKDVRERMGNPLGPDFQPSSLNSCVQVKIQRKEQAEQLAINRANKCIDEVMPCQVPPCPTYRVCYDGNGMPKQLLGENLTKAEQICKDKMDTMTWTAVSPNPGKERFYSECVNEQGLPTGTNVVPTVTTTTTTPATKTAGFMGLPKVAWIAIVGVGVYAYSQGMLKKLIK